MSWPPNSSSISSKHLKTSRWWPWWPCPHGHVQIPKLTRNHLDSNELLHVPERRFWGEWSAGHLSSCFLRMWRYNYDTTMVTWWPRTVARLQATYIHPQKETTETPWVAPIHAMPCHVVPWYPYRSPDCILPNLQAAAACGTSRLRSRTSSQRLPPRNLPWLWWMPIAWALFRAD